MILKVITFILMFLMLLFSCETFEYSNASNEVTTSMDSNYKYIYNTEKINVYKVSDYNVLDFRVKDIIYNASIDGVSIATMDNGIYIIVNSINVSYSNLEVTMGYNSVEFNFSTKKKNSAKSKQVYFADIKSTKYNSTGVTFDGKLGTFDHGCIF